MFTLAKQDSGNVLLAAYSELSDDTDRILVARAVCFADSPEELRLPVESAIVREEARERYREDRAAGYLPVGEATPLLADLAVEPARPTVSILPPDDPSPGGNSGGKKTPTRAPRPILPPGGGSATILEPAF